MIKWFLLLLIASVSCSNAPEEKKKIPLEFTAKVIGVKDGDTIEILYEEKPIVIRLEHVDCPEKKQPYGNKAKQFTSDFIFGKMARIVSKGKRDRYKRLIAVVYNEEGVNMNKALVENGLALHFKRYSDDMSYDKLELVAKENRVGMWSQPDMVAPWVYRSEQRKTKKKPNAVKESIQ